LCHLLSLPPEPFIELIRSNFRRKGERVVEANLKCFRLGHAQASSMHPQHASLGELTSRPRGQVVNGNQALALGALDAGLNFFAGYPITPATSIMEMVAKELPRLGGWMHQAEDEIAAAGAVLGAAFAGKRAMTATSGPGLALMSEMIGMAVMAEIPAVFVDVQRGGPATGLPTKVEQGDLNIALFGGAGDCPRVVMAPSTCSECYTGIQLAMDLAEKYQTPVIFLSDLFLANRVVVTDINKRTDRTRCVRKKPGPGDLEDYRRFRITEDGVSPLLVPGEEGAFYTITGLEHSEMGNPNYEVGVHRAMTEKRYRKFLSMLSDIPPAEVVGDEDAAIGFSAWGSPTGAIIEGMEIARAEGIKSKLIRSLMIYPQPETSYRAFFESCERIIIPEMNYQGQYAAVMKARYGIHPIEMHLPGVYPVSPAEIAQVIREVNHELVGKTPSLAGR
jgi:2-oxoglutarate ferredoxin oxidoreductase subunit alpha